MIPLGTTSAVTSAMRLHMDMLRRQREASELASRQGGAQYATFFVDGYWLAVSTDCVQEAVTIDKITHLPGLGDGLAGAFLYRHSSVPVVRLQSAEDLPKGVDAKHLVVVVSAKEGQAIGILAHQLGPVLGGGDIQDVSSLGFHHANGFVSGILKTGSGNEDPVSIVIDPEKLLQCAGGEDFALIWQQQIDKMQSLKG
jgi:chemotaxis signal transduction protein